MRHYVKREPFPTSLTFEEKNPESYLYKPSPVFKKWQKQDEEGKHYKRKEK